MLSIVLITYKHAKYIQQTIESILCQKLDFVWELIIADDASPDDTEKIVAEIIQRYPHSLRIRYFKQEKNIGMMPNFRFALNKAQFSYIAICEGDDFWVDEYKLQKQIDFLLKNKNVDFIFTGGYLHDESKNGLKTLYWSDELFQTGIVNKNKMFKCGAGSFITSSLVINKKIIVDYVRENHVMTDVFLMLHASRFGDFAYIKDPTTCYRINTTEAWSTQGGANYAFLEKEILSVIADEDRFKKKYGKHKFVSYLKKSQYLILVTQYLKQDFSKIKKIRKVISNIFTFHWKTSLRLLQNI